MTSRNEKTLNATAGKQNREEGNRIKCKGNETMTTSIPQTTDNFDTKFVLQTGNAKIWVQPQNTPHGTPVVELTDDHESNMLLSPAEALTVAAALEAVAVHLLEEPRELTRRTEPGNPTFEEDL